MRRDPTRARARTRCGSAYLDFTRPGCYEQRIHEGLQRQHATAGRRGARGGGGDGVMSQTFQGSFVAMVTPFRNGKVDEAKLKELVEFHVTNGTDGLIPCGTTGE